MNPTLQTIIASGSAKGTPMEKAIFLFDKGVTSFFLGDTYISGKGQYVYTLNGKRNVVDLYDDYDGQIFVPEADEGTALIVRGEEITEINNEESNTIISANISGTSISSFSHTPGILEVFVAKNCNSLSGDLRLELNALKTIDLSGSEGISGLQAEKNRLKELDFSKLADLRFVNVNGNQFEKIDLANHSNLVTFYCIRNVYLKELNVSGCPLANFNGSDCPNIETIYYNATNAQVAGNIAAMITSSNSTSGTVYLDSSDTYYSTVADAATAKGWTILPL